MSKKKMFLPGSGGRTPETSGLAQIGVMSNTGTKALGVDRYGFVACRNDSDDLEIGVSSQHNDRYAEQFMVFFATPENGVAIRWDAAKAATAYTSSCVAQWVTFQQWSFMISKYMSRLVSNATELTAQQWLQTVADISLPWFTDLEDLQDCSANTLRSLSAAHGLSPKSVKKKDVAAAVFEHVQLRKSSGPSVRFYGPSGYEEAGWISDDPGSVTNYLGTGNHRITVALMLDIDTGGTSLRNHHNNSVMPLDMEANWPQPSQYILKSSTPLEDNLFGSCNSALSKLRGFNPTVANDLEAAINVQTVSLKAMDFQRATAEIIANKKVREAGEELSVLRSAIESNKPASTRTDLLAPGEEEVDVVGVWFRSWKSSDAPDLLPNYSLGMWRAEQRLGRGGAVVTFDAADLASAVLSERVVSLVGPPGVGKTSVVTQLGAVMGVPVHTIQFTKEKPCEQLIGCDKIVNGEQVWVDGEITQALRHAASCETPVFVVLDERDHADPSVQSELHSVLEGRPLCLPNESIPVGDNVCFIMTSNTSGHGDTTGRHSAANMSDSAFNSRVKCTFNVSYLEPDNEAGLLCLHGLASEEAQQMVKFANATRDSVAQMDSGESFDGMSEAVCLRHLLSYTSCRNRGMESTKAMAASIVSALPADDRLVANELALQYVSTAFE